MRTLTGRLDILAQIYFVDVVPYVVGHRDRFLLAQHGKTMEEGGLILKDCSAQREKAFHEPGLNVTVYCVHVDREVEEVGHEERGQGAGACLQYVQPFYDQDI